MKAVADLGEERWERSSLPSRKTFRFFFQKKRTKNEFILPRTDFKEGFFADNHPSLLKS